MKLWYRHCYHLTQNPVHRNWIFISKFYVCNGNKRARVWKPFEQKPRSHWTNITCNFIVCFAVKTHQTSSHGRSLFANVCKRHFSTWRHALLRSEILPLQIESNSIPFYFILFFPLFLHDFCCCSQYNSVLQQIGCELQWISLAKMEYTKRFKWRKMIYKRCVDSTQSTHLYHHFLFRINSPHPLCQAIQLTRRGAGRGGLGGGDGRSDGSGIGHAEPRMGGWWQWTHEQKKTSILVRQIYKNVMCQKNWFISFDDIYILNKKWEE